MSHSLGCAPALALLGIVFVWLPSDPAEGNHLCWNESLFNDPIQSHWSFSLLQDMAWWTRVEAQRRRGREWGAEARGVGGHDLLDSSLISGYLIWSWNPTLAAGWLSPFFSKFLTKACPSAGCPLLPFPQSEWVSGCSSFIWGTGYRQRSLCWCLPEAGFILDFPPW